MKRLALPAAALTAMLAVAVSVAPRTAPLSASTAPPTGTPIPVTTLAPQPSASPEGASAANWQYVAANNSLKAARIAAHCQFASGADVPPIAMALVSGTTYRVVALCSNGALLTSTVTF